MANNSFMKDFVVKAVIGAGLGIVVDAIVEISRVPVFNDTGLLGNSKLPNYELFVYLTAGGITGLSILDIAVNSKPFGISQDLLPYASFFIIGTALWDNTLAQMLGLRNFNIYDVVENAIPNVRGLV